MTQEAFEVEVNGQTIRGTSYQPAVTTRVPSVLLLHGFTGQRIEAGFLFVQIARSLCARGIGAVTFDFRNSGESDGSFDQMLVTEELADALRMIRWVQGRPNVDRTRLGLLGFSLGGLLGAACMSRTDNIRSLALLAPTTVANLCRMPASCQTSLLPLGRIHCMQISLQTSKRSIPWLTSSAIPGRRLSCKAWQTRLCPPRFPLPMSTP